MICRGFDIDFLQSKLKTSLAGGYDDVPESSVTVFSDFRGGKSRARLSGLVTRLLTLVTKNRFGAVYNAFGKSNINENNYYKRKHNKCVDAERRCCHKKLRKNRNFCASLDSLVWRCRHSASGHDWR